MRPDCVRRTARAGRAAYAALVGTAALALLAACGGGSSEPPPQTRLDAHCPVVTPTPPAVPPGRHASSSPRTALDEALAHKVFGAHRPSSRNGYYQEQTLGSTDVVYFVHYVIRRPTYEIRVAKTSDGGWFYAGEGPCVRSLFQK